MDAQEKKGYAMVFAAGILWGTIGLFVKELQSMGLSTEMTSFLRLFSAFAIMLVYGIIRFGWKGIIVDRNTLGLCILMGIVVQGICNLAYSYAVTQLGVSVAVVFMDSAPIYTLFFAAVIFHEKMTRRKIIAVILDIIGCVLAATNGNFSVSTMTATGIAAGLISGITYSLSTVFGRFATKRTNPYIICIYCYMAAMIFVAFIGHPWTQISTVTPRACLIGILFGLVPTAITYVLYYGGIAAIKETSKVPVVASIELVIATLIGVLRYGDPIGFFSVTGIVLILASIAYMNRPDKQSA